MVAASYSWSALNTFLFGHGPMTLTLADMLMLTDLNVSESDNFFSLPANVTRRIKTRQIGG